MPDPKKKVSTKLDNTAVSPSVKKKVASDKDKVVNKKAKKYTVIETKRQKQTEKDGQMNAAREKAFEKDVKAAGGMDAYLKKLKEGKKKVALQRARRRKTKR